MSNFFELFGDEISELKNHAKVRLNIEHSSLRMESNK